MPIDTSAMAQGAAPQVGSALAKGQPQQEISLLDDIANDLQRMINQLQSLNENAKELCLRLGVAADDGAPAVGSAGAPTAPDNAIARLSNALLQLEARIDVAASNLADLQRL